MKVALWFFKFCGTSIGLPRQHLNLVITPDKIIELSEECDFKYAVLKKAHFPIKLPVLFFVMKQDIYIYMFYAKLQCQGACLLGDNNSTC